MSYQQQASFLDNDPACLVEEPNARYLPDFLENQRQWFHRLQSGLRWNDQFKSRKTATFGVSYNYSAGTRKSKEMPGFLLPVCKRIYETFNYYPNNCLVNYYPDGEHYISFHSDQDMEMKAQSGVTIVSLGSVRTMALRSISHPQTKHYYPLQPGSAFFMEDTLQAQWQHGISRQAGAGPRISLSFRCLLE